VKDIIKESADWFKEHLGDPNPEWKEFKTAVAPVTTTSVVVPVTTTPVVVPITTTSVVVPITTTPVAVPVTTIPVIVNTNVEIVI